MKKLFIIITLVAVLIGCSKKDTDLYMANLHGAIKNIITKSFSVDDSFFTLGNKKFQGSVETIFNKYGFKVEEITKDEDNEVTGTMKYEYDASQKLLREQTVAKSGDITSEKTYTYNDEGLLISEVTRVKGIYATGTYYTYNSDGQLTDEKRFIDEDLKLLISWTKYTYDDDGNRSMEANCDNKGAILTKHLLFYDKKGQLIEDNYYGFSGNFSSRRTYAYDRNGNIIETIEYGNEGQTYGQTNYEYDYDSRNNWISKLTRTNSFAGSLIEREIEY